MAKKLGNNYRLYVKAASPATTFGEVKGQGNLAITRQAGTIDLSSKSDAPYGMSAPGLRSVSISCACLPDLPDTAGYGRVETLSTDPTTPAEVYQIRKAPFADPADVVFEASMYSNISTTSMNMNEGTGVSIDLTLAAAPTKDQLA